MLKNIKYLVLAGVTVFSVSSCEDILETEPRQSVSFEQGTNDISGLKAILISAYDRIQTNTFYGAQMMLAPDVMADNLEQTSTNSNRYTGFVNNNHGTHLSLWSVGYDAINDLNLVLSGIDGSNGTPAEKTQIKGEALFLRGLIYFDLVRVYGYEPGKEVNNWNEGVIIRETPTLTKADANKRTRSTNAEVYAIVKRDLKAAIELLQKPATAAGYYRGNKAAAEAILARVSLYESNYADAIKYATDALATSGKTLVSGATYVNSFKTQPHPEALFEINYVQSTENLGVNESLNSLTSSPGTFAGAWGDIVPTNELLNLYETADVRKGQFVVGKKGTATPTYTTKYSGAGGAWTDNVRVIRVSELYLIRAEAYAETGNLVAALEDLNRLRTRAGATLVVAATKDAIIDAILKERRLELVAEGHRFFDLKRKGMTISKPSGSGFVPVPYNDPRILAPIPVSQIQYNPELEQNPGY